MPVPSVPRACAAHVLFSLHFQEGEAAAAGSPFHRGAAVALAGAAVSKLGDRKLKDAAAALLTALAQAAGPGLVVSKVRRRGRRGRPYPPSQHPLARPP